MSSLGRRRYRSIYTLIVILLTLAGGAQRDSLAQTTEASLSGHVQDVQGGALPGAMVTVTNTATGATRTLPTDGEGRYQLSALQPGPYEVKAEISGFAPKTLTGITLNVGDVKALDITLAIGGVTDTVSVQATESLLQTQTSSNGALIDNKQVVELPLANRQFYNLALLSPAAYQPAQNSTLGFRGGINIAGASEISNEFTVNGIYNNDMATAQPSFRPSVEVIQEFHLLTGVYPAEYGGMSGGQLVIITKSGTNTFHGSAYEFIRNQVTDAKNFFTQANTKTPSFKQNTFGGTLGGPILKDKAFFFFGYEGQRIRQAVTALATVPTSTMLGGTFASTAAAPLYDPNTGAKLPVGTVNLTTAFSGEAINWSSAAAKAGQLIANLGFPAPTNSAASSNYNFNEIRSENMNEYTGRIDGSLSQKDSVNFSYNAFIDPAFEPSNSLCSSYVLPNFGCFTNQISTLINLTYQRIFSPNLINSITVGYQRLQQPRVQQDDTSIGSAYTGLPGGPYFTQPNYANNLGLPNTSISGFATIGGATNLPQNRWDGHYVIADQVTWTHGPHTIAVGTNLMLVRTINLITSSGRGSFSVNDANIVTAQGKTAALPHLGSVGNSLADFLLGLTYSSTIGPTATNVYMNFEKQDFFVQDDWKLRPNLTLNLGLRYELDHPVYSPNNSLSNFSLSQDRYNQVGVNGNPKGLYNADNNNFAPRIGFSYSPFANNKTVVKAASGIFYNMPLTYNEFLTNGTQAPFRFVSTYTSAASSAGKINTIQLGQPFTIPNTAAPTPCTTGGQIGCSPSLAGLNIQPGYRTPYLTEWSFGVEQSLTKSMVFETTYFGSKGTKLPLGVPVNVINPATANGNLTQGNRPFPNFNTITSDGTVSNSEFHSWQNSLKQSYSNGVSFMLAYTWAKSIDGGGGIGSSSNSSTTVQNVYNLRADRGLSDFDVRHRIVFSPVAELPFGHGKPYLNHGIESGIMGGFQVSGIFSWQTGRPFTVTDSASNNSGSFEAADRPNVIANPNAPVDSVSGAKTRTVQEWFNAAAFQLAPAGQFGSAGRNIIEGPWYTDLDLTLAKQFPIYERVNGQFRVETFNILNHPSFFNPLSTGTQFGTTTFGQVTQANTPRQLQFAMRFLF